MVIFTDETYPEVGLNPNDFVGFMGNFIGAVQGLALEKYLRVENVFCKGGFSWLRRPIKRPRSR